LFSGVYGEGVFVFGLISKSRFANGSSAACVALLAFTLLLAPRSAQADEKPRPPRTAFDDVFDRLSDVSPAGHFEHELKVHDVNLNEPEAREPKEKAELPQEQPTEVAPPKNFPEPLYPGPQVKADSTAPGSFQSIVTALDEGNEAAAKDATSRFVDYLSELLFKVNAITRLIGQEKVRRKEMSEEELEGALDVFAHGMAAARETQGFPARISYDTAMKHIETDPKGEANVYYFFTLNCSNCRKMAPDVERLWRATLPDQKVRMAVLTLGNQPRSWIDSYMRYTGMRMPILNGEKIAKKLGVRFAPTVVVVAPNTGNAYRMVGQQNFEELYGFVRRVQGLPQELSTITDPKIRKLIDQPIGEVEERQAQEGNDLAPRGPAGNGGPKLTPVRAKVAPVQTIERF
jgi:hypothetical protein